MRRLHRVAGPVRPGRRNPSGGRRLAGPRGPPLVRLANIARLRRDDALGEIEQGRALPFEPELDDLCLLAVDDLVDEISNERQLGAQAAASASAEGLWRPTIAGASCTRSSSSRASTMNRAKSTRRVMLLSRTGSPTWWLHTGRPWLSPSSRSLPRTTVQRVSLAKMRWAASTWASRSTTRARRPSRPAPLTSALSRHE